ncbi:MAG TPA: hypothetical protein PKH09_02095 [Parvularculaceae bacterium]|nr:hypothetical protein [Parvularculaceae bacterium]
MLKTLKKNSDVDGEKSLSTRQWTDIAIIPSSSWTMKEAKPKSSANGLFPKEQNSLRKSAEQKKSGRKRGAGLNEMKGIFSATTLTRNVPDAEPFKMRTILVGRPCFSAMSGRGVLQTAC